MVSPENRHVTRYENYKCYLLAARNKENGKYLDSVIMENMFFNHNISFPGVYHFDSFNAIINNIKNLPALEEGYVLCNENNWRIKIKNPSYLAIAHLRNDGVISPKRIIKLIFENDYEEYLQYYPEDRQFFNPYINAYSNLIDDINKTDKKVRTIKDRKEFALAIKDCPFKSILFSMRSWFFTKKSALNKMSDNYKINLINHYVK